jgi:hypothetical protein
MNFGLGVVADASIVIVEVFAQQSIRPVGGGSTVVFAGTEEHRQVDRSGCVHRDSQQDGESRGQSTVDRDDPRRWQWAKLGDVAGRGGDVDKRAPGFAGECAVVLVGHNLCYLAFADLRAARYQQLPESPHWS